MFPHVVECVPCGHQLCEGCTDNLYDTYEDGNGDNILFQCYVCKKNVEEIKYK